MSADISLNPFHEVLWAAPRRARAAPSVREIDTQCLPGDRAWACDVRGALFGGGSAGLRSGRRLRRQEPRACAVRTCRFWRQHRGCCRRDPWRDRGSGRRRRPGERTCRFWRQHRGRRRRNPRRDRRGGRRRRPGERCGRRGASWLRGERGSASRARAREGLLCLPWSPEQRLQRRQRMRARVMRLRRDSARVQGVLGQLRHRVHGQVHRRGLLPCRLRDLRSGAARARLLDQEPILQGRRRLQTNVISVQVSRPTERLERRMRYGRDGLALPRRRGLPVARLCRHRRGFGHLRGRERTMQHRRAMFGGAAARRRCDRRRRNRSLRGSSGRLRGQLHHGPGRKSLLHPTRLPAVDGVRDHRRGCRQRVQSPARWSFL
jgi:hypothetical protein